jgi:hypothetical protein
VPEPTPVDPEVAAALLRSHLEDFFKNSPRVQEGDGWGYEITANPLVAIVRIPARALDADARDVYTVQLDATYYDTWPVSATFVEANGDGWRRARIGTPAFPFLRGSPGAPPGDGVPFQLALHDNYQFPGEAWDQLICFSYNLGYYASNHSPTEGQKWRPGQDRLDATVSRIHISLNSAAYLGPSTQVEAA